MTKLAVGTRIEILSVCSSDPDDAVGVLSR